MPALSISSGAMFQDADASTETGRVLGPSRGVPSQPIRPATDGNDLLTTPVVGGSLELMTPRLLAGDWAPRVFAYGGAMGAFGPDRKLTRELSIDELSVDPGISVGIAENVVQGQGSHVEVTVGHLVLQAGVGLAWPFQVLDRSFRIRASAEYVRETIEAKGAIRRAVCNTAPPPGPCGARNPDAVDGFRQLDLNKKEKKDYHGVGPGLELEMDAGRLGAVLTSVSVGARAYHFMGDRKVSFSDTNEFGETARFEFEKDAWGYQAGVAFRLRWVPE